MTKERPLISIVIPVYNAGQYLERCLKSVAEQSYSGMQIILVDDGSTDDSGEICDRWAARDARMEVIHETNAGLGMARNAGIEKARGDYLAFVDSDDYAEREMLESLLRILQEQGGEVCCGGHIKLFPDGTRTYGEPPEKLVYDGPEEMTEFLKYVLAPPPEKTYRGFAGMFIWGNLYEASLFKDKTLRFRKEPDIVCGDLFFNLAVFKRVRRVVIAPYCLYNYCINGTSVTQKYRKDRFEMTKNVKRTVEQELKEELLKNPEIGSYIDRNYMDYLIGCMRSEIGNRHLLGRKRCLAELRQMAGDETTQQVLSAYPVGCMETKQKILFTLILKKRIRLVYWLFRVRYRI